MEDERFAFVQKDILCSIQNKAAISKNWILLDNQSNVKIFSNERWLMNIRDEKQKTSLIL